MKTRDYSRVAAFATFVAAFVSMEAHALTATSNFNVTATLQSACEFTAVTTAVAFTYTSFQAGPATAAGGAVSLRCTNTLPYTLSLDAAAGTVVGLNYTLSLSAAGGTGNGVAQAYSVNGSMVAGQSGTCATTATCSGSQARILTVTY